jgi:CheY-like chemotaxis protein
MATILMVEDDEGLAYALSRALKAAGHHVLIACDGFSALDTLDGAEHIDCLIVDLLMPKGHPHGLAIAKMGRQKRRDLAVIYMTGHLDLPARIEQENVLLKPVDPDLLIREIHARLGATLQHA